MSEQDPTPSELFADFLARSGEDLESLCDAHPEHAEQLRNLHRDVENMRGFLKRAGSVGPPTEPFEPGAGGEPGVLAGPGGEASNPKSSPLMERLRGRSGVFDRYQLQDEVGRGGQGEVRRVWDQDFRRNLAMKVLLGTGLSRLIKRPQDPRKVSRFIEEAQVTGQLDHPGIVPVHEIGLDPNGNVYFTMKLVEGDDLGVIFHKVHEPESEWGLMRAIAVLLKVCEAVSFAHSRGVVHRDLKPANVMVGLFGEVYVMDWGLARVMDVDERDNVDSSESPGSSGLIGLREVRSERRDLVNEQSESPLRTHDGAIVGTPAFMSPEQARGELGSVGPRSDVYSIGAMLYELLTGKRPHGAVREGAGHSPRALLRDGPPRPIERLVSGVPAELVAICEKAMAREKADRYASVADLRLDLQAFVGGRVVRAYRTGAVVELVKWVKRNRVLASAGAIVAVLIVGGLLAGNAAERRRVEEVGREKAVAKREAEEARWQSYVANLRTAAWSLDSESYAEAHRRLEECPEEFRGWEWRHLSLRMDQSIHAWSAHSSAVTALAFDAVGRELVSGSGDSSVRAWSAADGAPLRELAPTGGPVLSLGYLAGPQARWTAAGDGRLRVWDAGGKLSTVPGEERGAGATHVVIPGTQLLVSAQPLPAVPGAQDPALAVSNVIVTDADGTEVWSRRINDALAIVAASRDGTQIVVGGRERAYLYDRRAGNLLTSQALGAVPTAVAFDPLGGRVALGLADGTLALWEFEKSGLRMASRVEEIDLLAESGALCLAFSPDGQQLVAGLESGRLTSVDMRTGRAERDLLGHTSPVYSLAFAPDGRRLASGDQSGTIRLWLGAGAAVVSDFDAVRDSGLRFVQVDQAGTRVVARGAGVVRIWDAADGSPIARFDVLASAFDPLSGRVFLVDEARRGRVLDSSNARVLADFGAELAGVDATNIAPGGEHVALALSDGSIELHPVEGASMVVAPSGTLSYAEDLRFSPDGSHLVVRDYRTLLVFGVATGALQGQHVLADEEDRFFDLACDPLGRFVAFTTLARDGEGDRWCGSLGVLDLEGAGLTMLVPARQVFASDALQTPDSIAFSPDGSSLASGIVDGSLRIWERGTWQSTTIQGPAEAWLGITFSPNGERIWARKADSMGIGVFDPLRAEWLLTVPLSGGNLDDLAYDAVHDRMLVTSGNRALLSLDGLLQQARGLWDAGALRGDLDGEIDTWADRMLLTGDVAHLRSDESLEPAHREQLAARVEWVGDPEVNALNELAWAAVTPDGPRRGNLERALRNARAAKALAPTIAEYRETLAWALFQSGRFEESVLEARAAVEIALPRDKPSYRETLLKLLNQIPE